MSIVISIIIMVILSLIAISFARIMRQEQQQAYERQLHTQAYYAAESAVNDVRREINQRLLTRQVHGLSSGFEGWVRSIQPDIKASATRPPGSGSIPAFDGAITFCGDEISALGYPTSNNGRGFVYIYKRLADREWHHIFTIGDFGSAIDDRDTNIAGTNVITVGQEHIPLVGYGGFPGGYSFGSRIGASMDCDSRGNLAIGDTDGGGVHFFEQQGDNWRNNPDYRVLTPTTTTVDLDFGASLSFIDDDTLLVGEGRSSQLLGNVIRIYNKDITNNRWNEELVDSNNNPGFLFTGNGARASSIAANSYFVVASTEDDIFTYAKTANGWSRVGQIQGQIQGSYKYARLALNGNFNDDRLLLAVVNYRTNQGNDPVHIYRYDPTLGDWSPAGEDIGIDHRVETADVNFVNLDVAFVNEFRLGYAISNPVHSVPNTTYAYTYFYRYHQPISDINIIEGQEDCRVSSGPLSEPFFDEGETVEYTCVFIDTRPDIISYDSISTERSLVVHLQPVSVNDGTDRPLSDLYVWWEAEDSPTNPGPSFSSGSPTFPFPTRANWNRQAPVLRVQLIPLEEDGYHREELRQKTKTFFLYPSTDNGDAVFWYDSSTTPPTPATVSGEVIGGYCDADSRSYPGSTYNEPSTGVFSKRVCGVRIKSIDAISPNSHNTYVLRILSMYEPSSITVEGYYKQERVVFKDIQVVVDATARAGHILRRIQERLPLIYIYDYPEYVLDIADDLCKNLESEPNLITYGKVGGVEVTPIASCELDYN